MNSFAWVVGGRSSPLPRGLITAAAQQLLLNLTTTTFASCIIQVQPPMGRVQPQMRPPTPC